LPGDLFGEDYAGGSQVLACRKLPIFCLILCSFFLARRTG